MERPLEFGPFLGIVLFIRRRGPRDRHRMENRRGHTVRMADIARSLTRVELAMTLPSRRRLAAAGQGNTQQLLIGTAVRF